MSYMDQESRAEAKTSKTGISKSLRYVIVRFAVVYSLLGGAMFTLQRSLLFFPSHSEPSGLLQAWADNGDIVGYSREVANPAMVWLMMHGNAGQAADRDYVLDHISKDDSLYVLEYPGYGTRQGSPSKKTFDQAASDAFQLLRRTYPNTPIGVIGESIGSGPASMLARERKPPEKIVLITPFDSLYNVASERFWFLPVWLLLLDRWDNIDALQGYEGQLEIYGATDDTVIPIDHAQNLAKAIPTAKFIEIPCGHNDWSFSSTVKIAR
jgi:uncharacterized protein